MSIDWTSISGYPRPVAADAVRLLVVVHELGQNVELVDRSVGRETVDREIVGEARLRVFDALIARPSALAVLLIERAVSESLADDQRRLLGNFARRLVETGVGGSGRAQASWTPVEVASTPWMPLDSALAALTSRGLLRIDIDSSAELHFQLTTDGSGLVERLTAANAVDAGALTAHHLACEALLAALPAAASATLEQLQAWLDAADEQLTEHRQARRIPVEVDALPSMYFAAFEQRL